MGISSIDFSVFYWVDTSQISLFAAQDAGLKFITEAFRQQGIEIPYPTRALVITREER